jgi:hydrogenase maturation protein HypF
MNAGPVARVAARFEVTGIVQGVGFRPFVHRLAHELGIDGVVGNDSTRVFVDAAGTPAALAELERRLVADAPPLARVERVVRAVTRDPGAIPAGFRIVESEVVSGARTLVPPDTAVCDDCLAELREPADRRFGHPFITCTNCGPRFTIIRDLPYDRPATTMAGFAMCPACAAEYADPSDRRYHAQPIACHDCGPTLVFRPGNGDRPTERTGAIERAVDALRAGLTVAVKGLGGYHLACDATSSEAVTRLRDRKHRPDKPFAVLVRNLAAARELAVVSEAEAVELVSPSRPIVLLRSRPDSALSPLVAPANPLIGVMLPHTPIQHLLVAGDMPPLVMTSGNLGGEPIAYLDDDAAARLSSLADAMLTHDRPIHVPCDDSVVRLVGDVLLPVRRARGFAPVPIAWVGATRSVLAVGGELKNTFCVASHDHAWVSQHIGDMENLPTLDAFEASVAQFGALYAVEPDVVAVDAHPAYVTTRWARERFDAARIVEVQHHHAHVAAVMAEHGLDPHVPVLGFAFDGTGYGTDGAIWGGEVLVADATRAERAWHLADVPLPGGDAAIRNPYRVALAHLAAAGIGWDSDLAPVQQLEHVERGLLERQLATGFNCAPTTSMGRLFDAVASLLGLRHRISFEAQAAIDLELAAERSAGCDAGFRFRASGGVIEAAPVVRALVDGLRSGTSPGELAFTFHVAVAELVRDLAVAECGERRLGHVVLSGGVFQNALLTSLCVEPLRQAGLDPLTHRLVPPNDGGLALGQAFVAAHPAHPVPPTHPVRSTPTERRA